MVWPPKVTFETTSEEELKSELATSMVIFGVEPTGNEKTTSHDGALEVVEVHSFDKEDRGDNTTVDPGAHSAQPLAPAAGATFPASHAEQVLDDVAPEAAELFPASHGVHADDPVSALYLPAGHCAHVVPMTTSFSHT